MYKADETASILVQTLYVVREGGKMVESRRMLSLKKLKAAVRLPDSRAARPHDNSIRTAPAGCSS